MRYLIITLTLVACSVQVDAPVDADGTLNADKGAARPTTLLPPDEAEPEFDAGTQVDEAAVFRLAPSAFVPAPPLDPQAIEEAREVVEAMLGDDDAGVACVVELHIADVCEGACVGSCNGDCATIVGDVCAGACDGKCAGECYPSAVSGCDEDDAGWPDESNP